MNISLSEGRLYERLGPGGRLYDTIRQRPISGANPWTACTCLVLLGTSWQLRGGEEALAFFFSFFFRFSPFPFLPSSAQRQRNFRPVGTRHLLRSCLQQPEKPIRTQGDDDTSCSVTRILRQTREQQLVLADVQPSSLLCCRFCFLFPFFSYHPLVGSDDNDFTVRRVKPTTWYLVVPTWAHTPTLGESTSRGKIRDGGGLAPPCFVLVG